MGRPADPADKVERRAVSRLIPYARNARTHSDAQVAQIAASIKEWGWTTPVLVDEQGGIIAGHGRTIAAQLLGMADVPVVVATGWSEAKKRAYVIADNKLALNAGWDNELLRLELGEIGDLGFDLDLTGFSAEEIAALEPEQVQEGLTDEDAAPDAPAVPVTVLGDVWILGDHRLMCGDSTSIDAVDCLLDGAKVDMVFTEPPYGIKVQMNNPGTTCKGTILGDATTDAASAVFQMCRAMSVPMLFWGANHYAGDARLPNASCWVVWDKQGGKHVDHADCELAWTNIKGPARVFQHIWDGFRRDSEKGEKRVHPTQKPIALIEEVLAFFKSGTHIADLFGGSGSTLIACQKTGRNAYLMELDPKYCDVIIKRWQDFTGKKAVHEQTGKTFAEIAP